MHLRKDTHTHIPTHKYTQTHADTMHTHAHAHTHTYTHTHAHTHTYTLTRTHNVYYSLSNILFSKNINPRVHRSEIIPPLISKVIAVSYTKSDFVKTK